MPTTYRTFIAILNFLYYTYDSCTNIDTFLIRGAHNFVQLNEFTTSRRLYRLRLLPLYRKHMARRGKYPNSSYVIFRSEITRSSKIELWRCAMLKIWMEGQVLSLRGSRPFGRQLKKSSDCIIFDHVVWGVQKNQEVERKPLALFFSFFFSLLFSLLIFSF